MPQLLGVDRVRLERRCDIPVDLDPGNAVPDEGREMLGCWIIVDLERLNRLVSARPQNVHSSRQVLLADQHVEVGHLPETDFTVDRSAQIPTFQDDNGHVLCGERASSLPALREKAEVSHRRLLRRQLERLQNPRRKPSLEVTPLQLVIEERPNALPCGQVQAFIPDVTLSVG